MSRDSNSNDDMTLPLHESSTLVVRTLKNLFQSYHSGLGYLIILRSATCACASKFALKLQSAALIWLQGLFFSKIVPYPYRGRQQII